MTHTGWRKPTPQLLQAERFAQVGEQLSVPKTQAIVAAKKVAAAIGLKAQDLLLLDTFGAVTQAQDWEQGRRPIVWASNHFLMEQTGFSLATLRRHVRRLCEVGVISMKDSPNGKRWGRRDADGVIIEAYGFDLAPLAARAEEFDQLYAELQAERARCAALRNGITVARRMIRAKIEVALQGGLHGPWDKLRDCFNGVLASLPGRRAGAEALEHVLDRLTDLLAQAEAVFIGGSKHTGARSCAQNADEAQTNDPNMEPSGVENDTHILTTKELDPVNCNCFETKPAAGDVPEGQGAALEKTVAEPRSVLQPKVLADAADLDVDIPIVMASCPHFAEMSRDVQGYVRGWEDLQRAANTLRPMVGISQDVWLAANKVLGRRAAAASLALILDKSATGEVRSPGGYLRGLVQKAQAGQLHLNRSFHGRLNA